MNIFDAVDDVGARYIEWLYFHDCVVTFQIVVVIITTGFILKFLWKALEDQR